MPRPAQVPGARGPDDRLLDSPAERHPFRHDRPPVRGGGGSVRLRRRRSQPRALSQRSRTPVSALPQSCRFP